MTSLRIGHGTSMLHANRGQAHAWTSKQAKQQCMQVIEVIDVNDELYHTTPTETKVLEATEPMHQNTL